MVKRLEGIGKRPHQLLIDKAIACGMPWLIKFERDSKFLYYFNYRLSVTDWTWWLAWFARKSITIIQIFFFIYISVQKSCKMLKMMCWSWYVAYGLSNLGSQPGLICHMKHFFSFLSHETLFSLVFWECGEFLRNRNIRRTQRSGNVVHHQRIDSKSFNINHNKEF